MATVWAQCTLAKVYQRLLATLRSSTNKVKDPNLKVKEDDLLGVCNADDLTSQTPNEVDALIHHLELGDRDGCGLVNTLPVLNLVQPETNTQEMKPTENYGFFYDIFAS